MSICYREKCRGTGIRDGAESPPDRPARLPQKEEKPPGASAPGLPLTEARRPVPDSKNRWETRMDGF